MADITCARHFTFRVFLVVWGARFGAQEIKLVDTSKTKATENVVYFLSSL